MATSTYGAQERLAKDTTFMGRVNSCVWQETGVWSSPPTQTPAVISSEIMPRVAASPGFADAYVWGDKAQGVLPGQEAITDGQILAAVQPLLEKYRPAPPQ